MKVVILGGFLGSGKTTVILQFAKYLVDQAAEGTMPVVILENEISSNGVDNQLLSRASFTVENLFSGCICCTSAGELGNSVKSIEEKYGPEWLVIEATGMAYPDNIQDTLEDTLGYRPQVLAIVDTKRWKKVYRSMPQFVESQLRGANVVLLTKKDLVEPAVVEEVIPSVQKLTEGAAIYPICAIEPQEDAFWAKVAEQIGGNQ